MSLKYNPRRTTNMPTAGRLRPVPAVSVSGEERQDQHHTARVLGADRRRGGLCSQTYVFKRENMPVNSDYACVSTF